MSGIPITGTFVPAGAGGFPLLEDINLLGGYRAVADNTARDAIPALDRKEGMLVRTNSNGITWALASDLTTWTVFGAGGGLQTLAFDSPQLLAAADLTGTPNRTIISVGTVNDQYIYVDNLSSPPAGDGLNIIIPTAPATARAVRQYLRNQLAQYETAWFIDPVAGDDRSAGTTIGAPLKTLVEWSNRLRFADLTTANVAVTIAAGTLTDIAPLDIHIGTGLTLTIRGTVTSTANRALTAVTNTAPAGNTRGTSSDTSTGTFARGQRLRMTSGAANGAITWCQGGTTGTVAAVTGWSRYTSHTPPGNILPTQVNPAPGDTYVVDTLATTFQGRFDVRVKGAGRFIFQDFNCTSDPASSFAAFQYWRPLSDLSSVSSVQFIGCNFDANSFVGFVGATCHIDQCHFVSACNVALNSSIGMSECVFQSTLTVFGSAYLQCQLGITLDGGRIVQTNAGFIELNGAQVQAGATASGGVAWEIDPGCATYQHQSARFWGPTSGYVTAVRIYELAAFQYVILPTLTGSSGQDLLVGNTAKNWADLPFANTVTLSTASALT